MGYFWESPACLYGYEIDPDIPLDEDFANKIMELYKQLRKIKGLKERVFVYYSGFNDRMERLSQEERNEGISIMIGSIINDCDKTRLLQIIKEVDKDIHSKELKALNIKISKVGKICPCYQFLNPFNFDYDWDDYSEETE